VEDVQAGRDLFITAGCASCHGGATWTASKLPGLPGELDADGNGMVDGVLRDVGTLNVRDLRGETGFDIPALVGVRLTAPYFHDGSAPTLDALLRSGHPDPQGEGNGLNAEEIAHLVRFLQSIDKHTAPVDAP
jgi:cytochrome c peroxidase